MSRIQEFQLTLSELLRELFLLVLPGRLLVDLDILLHLLDQVARAELSCMEASVAVSYSVNAIDCATLEFFMYHYLKKDNCVSMFLLWNLCYLVKRNTYAIFLLVQHVRPTAYAAAEVLALVVAIRTIVRSLTE